MCDTNLGHVWESRARCQGPRPAPRGSWRPRPGLPEVPRGVSPVLSLIDSLQGILEKVTSTQPPFEPSNLPRSQPQTLFIFRLGN